MEPPNPRDRRTRSPVPQFEKVADRASNGLQNVRARKTEAAILEQMHGQEWLSGTSISQLIGANDDRKTRSARSIGAGWQSRAQAGERYPRFRLSPSPTDLATKWGTCVPVGER